MIVAPVIPGATTEGLLDRLVSPAVALPLPALLPDRTRSGLEYAIARVSPSGRVCVWPLLDRLGWRDDVRLAATVVGTSLLMRRDPGGVFMLGKRRMVVLPIMLRRRCGISAGDDAFMVADPARGVLVVHPASALDQMVTGYHASLVGGDRDDR
ncbi:hypothetical protein [Amycolatopsis australiensis]|uniref:hypothetical protein n=1 Tax=Amycolatopsis australiensis TaxID=546364 RepID=UPI001160E495|nr:hypothetical protein [Amycolatopsis australiensis]